MKNILTSLSPNTESDDLLLAWRQLLTPWRWRDQSANSQLEQAISSYLQGVPVVLTSSGRSALYYAMRALGIGASDEVIVQAFTCVTVPAAVQWVGAKPIYTDISEETYNLDPSQIVNKITPKTKAIIVQHTLGIPAPIAELKDIAQKHNIFLIEDCAHAFGGTYQGQPLGLFGDIAILSFGRDKVISSVFGGAIVCRNESVLQQLRAEQSKLPLPSGAWVVQQLLHPISMSLIMPLYFRFMIGKALLVVLQNLHILSKAITENERHGGKPKVLDMQLSPALAALALKQLQKLPRYLERRRANVARYRASISSKVKLPSDISGASWLRLPVLVPNPTQIHTYTRERNILLGDWYNAAVAPRSVDPTSVGYTVDSCPVAERLAASVINLPTGAGLAEADIDRITKTINDFFDDSRN